jgi:hypothetical protein
VRKLDPVRSYSEVADAGHTLKVVTRIWLSVIDVGLLVQYKGISLTNET